MFAGRVSDTTLTPMPKNEITRLILDLFFTALEFCLTLSHNPASLAARETRRKTPLLAHIEERKRVTPTHVCATEAESRGQPFFSDTGYSDSNGAAVSQLNILFLHFSL